MLQPRSSLAVRRTERPALAPFWLIGLLAACTLALLVLLYPRQDLEHRIWEAEDSALSENYLQNLLRSDPDSPRLHLVLARREVRLNKLAAARQTLQVTLNSTDENLRRDAQWVLFEINEAELQRIKSGNPLLANKLRDTLRHQIRELATYTWPREQQLELAQKASRYGDRDLGQQLFRKLVQGINSPKESTRLFAEAAQEGLAQGDYQGAAAFYLEARKNTDDPQQARSYFHAALKALQSGNQPLAAIELGDREIGVLIDDPDTLWLMTQLARAAGRPDIADRYVRRLLRLSLLQQWQRLQMARAWGPGQWLQVSQQAEGGKPGIPFNDKYFTLGYEVFLENRKLEDAWQIASAAVRQAPDDLNWRQRLATVSEWTNRPKLALDNWHFIAQHSQRDDAWQSVLRLAPGLFDDAALIPALQYQLGRQPNDARLIKELVAAYERQGDPRGALAFLEHTYRRNNSPILLQALAELAERAGDIDLAIASWQQLLAMPEQLTPRRAMHLSLLMLQRGRGEDGLPWLEKASTHPQATADDSSDYWRLTGQLAEEHQNDALALAAFRQLIAQPHAEAGDYDALIRILTPEHPQEAADAAAQAWLRFDQARHLIQALNLYAADNRWQAMGALFKQLDAGRDASHRSLRQLQGDPAFLRLWGSYQQNTGHAASARRSFEAALRLDPGSSELRQSLLWLLIDTNEISALRKLLTVNEAEWQKTPELHDALAAAYQAQSLPQIALQRYLTPHLQAHRDDFLWLMNYADALDQNQQSDRAWRLRRRLLSEEWQQVEHRGPSRHAARQRWLSDEGLSQTQRTARARLLLTQRPGDVGLDALRELLRLDRKASEETSSAALETAIGWLQDAGEFTAERGFLWQQYARSRQRNRALWAEITVALAEKDIAETGQLLLAFDAALPRYDRINAAAAVGDVRLAQTAAFETQTDQTDDDPIHLQLTEQLLNFSDYAGLGLINRRLGDLNESEASTHYHLAVSPRLSLDFEWGRIARDSSNGTSLINAPDEHFAFAQANWLDNNGKTTLRIDQRESLASYTPVRLERELRIDNRLSLYAALGTSQPSQESLPLRVAGMKDQASLTLNYRPTRMDQLTLEHRRERYKLQTGLDLGEGAHTSLTATHLYRQEARDLEFSAFWSNHQFARREGASSEALNDPAIARLVPDNLTPGPDYFLPDSFNFYGLRVATDMRYETEYTRALRPFGSLSLTRHSRLGSGYDARLGVASSVFGADHLSLGWGVGKSGMQSGGLVRDLRLNYRIHY